MRYFVFAICLAVLAGGCKSEDKKLEAIKAQFNIASDESGSIKSEDAYDWLGDPKNEATPYLVEVLQKDKVKYRRSVAAAILGMTKDKQALKPLIKALDDPESLVRLSAMDGLGALGDPEAGAPILENAKINILNPGIARKILGQLKYKPAVPFITEGLTAKSHYDREFSIRALGQIQGLAAKPAILKLKDDPDPGVRGALAAEIHRLDPSDPLPGKLVPGLIATLNSEDVLAQSSAIRDLGDIGDRRAIKPILPFLENRPVDMRMEAVEALAKLKAKEALPKISKLQYDVLNRDLRIAAGKAVKALK